ncbi:hypothetical protein CDCA_CDCA11G3300 [Cyanidium caldarium]|uniref:Sm domain-containing protein n=1 Tax=Cyanidium caldarium TaxID=2771 RepID=A0AAV9IY66_CYACA|nr:hypothetical protein CDCA_CDCA11G3300 [Cyanidium caldarium]
MFFAALFQTLVGQVVTVELKNDLCIRGTLLSVDPYLNVRLADVVVTEPEAFPALLALRHSCTVRGSCVRYVHLPPDQVDVQLLQDATRQVASAVKAARVRPVGE